MLLLMMQPHPSNHVLLHMGLLPHLHKMTEWESGCLEPSLLFWQCSFASHVKTGVLFLLTVVTFAEFTENMSNTVGTKAFPSFARNKIWKYAWLLISMIYFGLGLSMCHLQAHPSWMQTLLSMRKGNLLKRGFPYKNMGYANSIAIPLAVH